MRTSRLKLTNLIKTIKESLDDGDDIYGYSGINKSMLIDSLSESYKLLSCFEEYNNLFEVTFMKRKVASIIDRANHYLIVICIVYQHITYPYIKNSSTNSNLVDYAI